jgi:hypothetical protein
MFPLNSPRLVLFSLLLPLPLLGQAAVDPGMAPRAAQLVRAGQPAQATELLGRYLATAPDDGSAWMELGQVYLLGNAAWHQRGHRGEPDGELLLDFAATAFDQSLRYPSDSAALLRATVELERGLGLIEAGDWAEVHTRFSVPPEALPPVVVLELGRNLVSSCPLGGVLVTSSDLEAIAAWGALFGDRTRTDLVPLLADRYDDDALYRQQMAQVLGMAPGSPLTRGLLSVAERRPVCLAPEVGGLLAASPEWRPTRLVRVAGAGAADSSSGLRITALLSALLTRATPVTDEVVDVYRAAGRANAALCGSLLGPLGPVAHEACGH